MTVEINVNVLIHPYLFFFIAGGGDIQNYLLTHHFASAIMEYVEPTIHSC